MINNEDVKKLSVQSLLIVVAVFLTSWAFNRTMSELDSIVKELKEIRISLERDNTMLSEHERRINRLEEKGLK